LEAGGDGGDGVAAGERDGSGGKGTRGVYVMLRFLGLVLRS
jgi:hypothetical protein